MDVASGADGVSQTDGPGSHSPRYPGSPGSPGSQAQGQDLEAMTVRELLAELARLQDRLRAESTNAPPLPGQMARRAAVRRQERAIQRELHTRSPADPLTP